MLHLKSGLEECLHVLIQVEVDGDKNHKSRFVCRCCLMVLRLKTRALVPSSTQTRDVKQMMKMNFRVQVFITWSLHRLIHTFPHSLAPSCVNILMFKECTWVIHFNKIKIKNISCGHTRPREASDFNLIIVIYIVIYIHSNIDSRTLNSMMLHL